MKKSDLFTLSGLWGPIWMILGFTLAGFLYPDYSILDNQLSELAAFGSPVGIFAAYFVFSLTGILISLFAIGLYGNKDIGGLGKGGSVLVFLSGLIMFLLGIFRCDAGCDIISFSGEMHAWLATVQFPIFALGIVLLAFEFVKKDKFRSMVPVILVLGLIALIFGFMAYSENLDYPGLVQRIATYVPYLILSYIAWNLVN